MHKHRNLFTEAEWSWFCELGASKHDPEEKKTFYEGVIEQKLLNKDWDFLKAFPKQDIPAQIISMLQESNKKKEKKEMPQPVKNEELENLRELFGKLIEEGKHLSDKEAS